MQITTDPGYNDYARGGHTLTTPSKFSSASHRSLAAHKQKLLVISTLSNHKNEGENKITFAKGGKNRRGGKAFVEGDQNERILRKLFGDKRQLGSPVTSCDL